MAILRSANNVQRKPNSLSIESKGSGDYKCEVCKKVFKRNGNLEAHRKRLHKSSKVNIIRKPFKQVAKKSKDTLKAQKSDAKVQKKKQDIAPIFQKFPRTTFKCGFCSTSFPDSESIIGHYLKNHQ